MKFFIILLLLLAFCSAVKVDFINGCSASNERDSTVNIAYSDFKFSNYNFCSKLDIKVNGIYPEIKTLPSANKEVLALDDYLKSLGFIQADYGYGNWENGPRFIDMKLVKDSCECHVYKIYTYKDTIGSGYRSMIITEEIHCK